MLRIVPLGGLGEVGLNSMVLETADDAVVVDCGLMFPREQGLGVDAVVPDLTYLRGIPEKLRAVVLTHGHEDHIGAVPFLLKEHRVPVYGSRFTLALLRSRLEEAEIEGDLRELPPGDRLELGHDFVVEGVPVTHSIPDGYGLGIDTPEGLVVHTGDFKIDHRPVDDRPTDLARFGALGKSGVLALLSDSTNSERPGVSLSERQVGVALEGVFARARSRVIISTFASNIHRIQQVLDASRRFGRKVVLVGRSMNENVRLASEMGLLEVPLGLVIDADEGRKLRHERVTVLSTGAQGEPRAALLRMAAGDPSAPFPIDEGDLVVLSSRFIPGNEVAIGHMVDLLVRRGAEVLYESAEEIHASGHACREEQRLMLRLVQPRHFVPIHGEYRHLARHAKTAQETGLAERACHLLLDGDVLQFEDGRAFTNGSAPSGRVYVESRAGPDVPALVLRERSLLAETGLAIVVLLIDKTSGEMVRDPELTSRGLSLPNETTLLPELNREVRSTLATLAPGTRTDANAVQEEVRRAVRRVFKRFASRPPVVLPVVIEL